MVTLSRKIHVQERGSVPAQPWFCVSYQATVEELVSEPDVLTRTRTGQAWAKNDP